MDLRMAIPDETGSNFLIIISNLAVNKINHITKRWSRGLPNSGF